MFCRDVVLFVLGNRKPVKCRSKATEKVKTATLNKMPRTASDSGTRSLHPPSHQCDLTASTDCSDSYDARRHFSSNAGRHKVKAELDPEEAGKCTTNSDSAVRRRRSSNVRRRKQIHGGARLVISGCSDSKTCSSCGHSLERQSDHTERLNCPQCQHVPVTGATDKSKRSEAIVKSKDRFSENSAVDASPVEPEGTTVSTVDQQQQGQHKPRHAVEKTLNSVNDKSSQGLHQCGICSRCCSSATALKRHELVHTERSYRSMTTSCQTCGKKFRHKSYLRCHERLHEGGERPFVCDVCGKGFIASSNLTTHHRTHTGDRPYACSVCHKRFYQLCAVRKHELIHVGIKAFVCDVCGKQFLTNAQLFNHSRIHSGEKLFECEVCQKRFYTNGDLVKHARIHADRRPFVCDVCGKGFKYSSNLHGHSRIHTGSRPFPCQTCGKAFTYSSHLSRHAKMHTRNNVLLEDEAASAAVTNEELTSPPAVTQSTSNIVGVTTTTPSAILLVNPELLLAAPQVATNVLPGFPVGPFTARLCN